MKQNYFLSAFLVFALLSCKKHTCTCTSYFAGNPQKPIVTEIRGFKSTAERRCQQFALPVDSHGDGTICVLD